MSSVDRMKTAAVLMILLAKALFFTLAWLDPPNRLIQNTDRHIHRSTYESDRGSTDSKYNNDNDEPSVKQIKTVQYHGNTYMHVLGLKLSYYQAERYCNQAFESESHLTSIQSDNEWKVLSKHFGSVESNEMWLGGFADLVSYQYVALRWIDQTPFEYNRFSLKEKERWRQILQNTLQGCIIGDMRSNAEGEWSLQSMPCIEPKEFICKQTVNFNNPIKPPPFIPARTRKYRTSYEPHFIHKHKQPPLGIFPLSDEIRQPNVQPAPKQPMISKVTDEQKTILPVANTQTEQTVTKPPQVQPTPTTTTSTNTTPLNTNQNELRIPLKINDNNKKASNVTNQNTKKSDSNIKKNKNKVKFIIIGPNGQKTEVLEKNINLRPGQILEPGTLNTNSGPLTIYLQGVSVPGN